MGIQNVLQRTGIFAKPLQFFKTTEGIVFGAGTGAAPAVEGWAPGALWLDITTAGGAQYRNTGTKATAVWSSLVAAAGSLDASFDVGKTIDGATTEANAFGVGGATDYFTFWQEGANDIRIGTSAGANITVIPAGGELALTGNFDASGTLKAGTANAFTVSAVGAVVAVGVNYGAGSLVGTGDIAISTNLFTVTGATGATLIAAGLQVAGAIGFGAGYNKFTVAAATGNTAIAGDLAVTGTITGTYGISAISNNLTITPSATTTSGVTIDGDTVTTGDILHLDADTSLSGYFIRCLGTATGIAECFKVGADGSTTIKGTAFGSGALTLTAGDLVLSNGGIDLTSSGTSADDLLDITRSNTATAGNGIDIAMGSAAVGGHGIAIAWGGAGTGDAINVNMTSNVAGGALVLLGAGTRTDALIDIVDVPNNGAPTIGISATTGHNSGHVVAIDLAAGTHSCDVLHLTTTGAFTGDFLNINLANGGVGVQAIVVSSAVANTSPTVSITTVGGAGGHAINIASTSASATGHGLAITETGTAANNLISLAYGGAHTGDAINILMTNAAAGAQGFVFVSAVAHTSPNVSLTSANGAAATLYMSNGSTDASGHGLSILQHGAGANNAINLAFDAASTGDAIGILMTNAAVTAQALTVTSAVAATNPTIALTTANGAAATLYMSNGSTDAAGHGISILQHGAGANNALYIAYDAASTGDAIGIVMNGAAITSQALVISSNVAHAAVNPVQISSTGFVGATGIALVSISASTSTLAHANASLTNITFTGTGASAGMGTNLRLVADGATNGGGVSYATYISASAAGLEALIVDAGMCRFDESVTLKAAGLTTGNRFFGVPNHVTCGGGANDITVALLDCDGVAVPLAEGLELYIDMGATTLQAGANNINLNAAGNVRIYKSSAPTVDKAVAVSANGVVHVLYNGTSWLDLNE